MNRQEFEQKIKEFIAISGNLSLLYTGIDALRRSSVLDILIEKAKPTPVEGYPNFSEAAVASMYRSIGYNQALEDLLYFKERYLDTLYETTVPEADFGARAALIASGEFTKEELDGPS